MCNTWLCLGDFYVKHLVPLEISLNSLAFIKKRSEHEALWALCPQQQVICLLPLIKGIFMNKTLLLASAAVLALSAGGVASAKSAHPSMVGPKGHYVHQTVFKTPKGSVTLYDQTDNDSGVGIVSDNFDSGSFDSYDNQGADDFTVPSGHTWTVTQVNAPGAYFNGSGPQDGVNVFFYKNKKGAPGKPAAEIDNITPTDSAGSFSIDVGKVKLKAGSYWVSVQANMNFVGGPGEWGWETSSALHGSAAMFRSAGGFGCLDWAPMQSCIGSYGEGPDFMFTLKGKDKS